MTRAFYTGLCGVVCLTFPSIALGVPVDKDCSDVDINGVMDLTTPAGYTSIPNNQFKDCTALTSVIFPADGLQRIGVGAFKNTGLITVNIPDSVTNLMHMAFQDNQALSQVTIGNGVTFIEYGCFLNNPNLHTVVIGNSVQTIYEYAFANCAKLASLTLVPV